MADTTRPSTTANRPVPARISPAFSAFFMAEEPAQRPRRAARAVASAASRARAQSRSTGAEETSAVPRANSSD